MVTRRGPDLLDAAGTVASSQPVSEFVFQGDSPTGDQYHHQLWTGVRIMRDSSGNAKVTKISNSPCSTPRMCGEDLPNR